MSFPSREERKQGVEAELRAKAREWIEVMVNEELDDALGLGKGRRGEGRKGYRKGPRERSFTTSSGKHAVRFPRGAYFEACPDGKKEWNSQIVPRYARRTEEVEDGLMRSYLCGTNMRKIGRVFSALLKGAALSKSTVSRIVARLSEHFEAWRKRDLLKEDIVILFLDGFHLKVRIGGKVESIPALCATGVRRSGTRVVLAIELRTSESARAWRAVTEDLAERGVTQPLLAVIDGGKGLRKAVKSSWPWVEVQRCTVHKLENIATHAPKRRYEEIKADYRAIVYAESEARAEAAWRKFERKWKKLCPAVVKSLREGGGELLTFYRWPRAMWKALRTTNSIERMNGEFRRRVKTQGSLPNAEAAAKLLFGLLACGLIRMRRIDGWRELGAFADAKRRALNEKRALEKAA